MYSSIRDAYLGMATASARRSMNLVELLSTKSRKFFGATMMSWLRGLSYTEVRDGGRRETCESQNAMHFRTFSSFLGHTAYTRALRRLTPPHMAIHIKISRYLRAKRVEAH